MLLANDFPLLAHAQKMKLLHAALKQEVKLIVSTASAHDLLLELHTSIPNTSNSATGGTDGAAVASTALAHWRQGTAYALTQAPGPSPPLHPAAWGAAHLRRSASARVMQMLSSFAASVRMSRSFAAGSRGMGPNDAVVTGAAAGSGGGSNPGSRSGPLSSVRAALAEESTGCFGWCNTPQSEDKKTVREFGAVLRLSQHSHDLDAGPS